ncbi:hypothetical protein V5N11_008891 [Cardamine amara subsp. amara]|uniref:Uncharacterized protein n=1 Tax=Cardamine amara subsp. amara TaxID=228776 RepID=A0ABD1A3I8_CARAN
MDDSNGKVKGSSKKRLRKTKTLEFVGWGSKNLIEFLQSLGKDTTNKISEFDVTTIILNYIRGINREDEDPSKKKKKKKKKKTKTVACDDKLRLLFECQKINILKVPDLLEKHYVENQDEDSYYDDLYASEDDKRKRLSASGEVVKQTKKVVQKPKGTFAAIVSDNVKLLYLRKSLVQELAKTPETFESKVMGTFVRIKNPVQLVQVTGVNEGNLLDGYILQVTNYTYYLKDVTTSVLSDDDFSQEECEELDQRMKNGLAKRLTVANMEEKVRSLHEDVTKHWIARELVLLQRPIITLFEYLEKRELLEKPEEQSRLLREVPEVVAEELELVCVDDDGKIENDIIVPQVGAEELESLCVDDDGKIENVPNPEASIEALQNDEEQQLSDSPVSSVQKSLENSKLLDGAGASAGDKDLHEDVEEQPENDITQKDTISEGEMNTKVTQQQSSIPVIDLSNQPQAQSTPLEIIELSDDDDDDDDDEDDKEKAYQNYGTKKVMWWYEFPKGETHGPFSLTDLKKWSEAFFVHVPDFKVWMTGQSKKSAVLLTKLLPHIKGT